MIKGKKIYRLIYNNIFSMLIVFSIMFFLYFMLGYAPFGENSLAIWDANIQYLDFFAYLKDVLAGKNDILYTFGKTLGGSNIAVFTYYLSSPLNLLVVFFEKASLHIFFHFLVAIKLSIAAFSFSYFLNKRFKKFLYKKSYSNFIIIGLSVSYALSQYCIAQSSNIMWLEGVYMLPLILSSVYEMIHDKVTWKLSFFVGISILFNWYTGGINCLFSIIWFLFELALREADRKYAPIKERFRDGFELILRYGCAMALGVVLSAVFFLPTIGSLQNSNRGSFDLSILLDFSFMGDVISVIQGYSLGATSGYGVVSLFCGSLALLGTLGCFFTRTISAKKKAILGGMLGLTILSFYWKPFFALFSLLKDATSYWYRYSYCGIMLLLFLAALFFLNTDWEKESYILIKLAISFSSILLILNYLNNTNNTNYIHYTVIFIVMIACAIEFMVNIINNKQIIRYFSQIFIGILLLLEITYSVKLQMENYHVSDVENYKLYVENQAEQIALLKNYDNELYRISQTSTRNMGGDNLTAYYNEALAYNYWSIAGYTSSPDDIQRELLDRLGYRINGENMCIVNTSILAADSLMGVKYVLSEYPINGLVKVEELNMYNGKAVYENPYNLPFSFVYEDNVFEINSETNPFVYQNELYSKFIGEQVDLYIPLEYELIQKGSLESNVPTTYSIVLPKGNYAVYGNIPWEYDINATLNVNNAYQTAYASWLSPSVFYIPTDDSKDNAVIEMKSEISYAIKEGQEQFYALDLDKLSEVVNIISSKSVDNCIIENGYAKITVKENKNGQNLYISIPYDSGWRITLNGKKIVPEVIADCMYSIPLDEGTNIVEMKYSVKYLALGIVVSVVGLICWSIIFIIEKKRQRSN